MVARVPARRSHAGHREGRPPARGCAGKAGSEADRRPAAGDGARAGRSARRGAAPASSRKTPLVYLAYAARGGDGVGTELARGRLAGHRLEERRKCCSSRHPRVAPASTSAGASCSTARAIVYLTLGDRGETRARAEARRPRRLGDPAARRRPRAEGQSVRRQAGLEAGEVHPRQPQHAGRGAASADRRCCGRTSTARRAATR